MFANTLKREVFADDFPLVPGLEVSERPGRLTLQVALGDVNPEEVSVAAEEGVLRIKGERKLEGVNRIYRFTRSMPLPSGVRATEITRDFHDGVLTVTVPLSTALVRKRVTRLVVAAAAELSLARHDERDTSRVS